jgi:hypothetical protein
VRARRRCGSTCSEGGACISAWCGRGRRAARSGAYLIGVKSSRLSLGASWRAGPRRGAVGRPGGGGSVALDLLLLTFLLLRTLSSAARSPGVAAVSLGASGASVLLSERTLRHAREMPSRWDVRQAEAAYAAGKATASLNASFSAYDYKPAKIEGGRSFLMDDYLHVNRAARAHEEHKRDNCWDILQYQKDVAPFQPRQGFSETKFHSGFMRRQGSQMPYLTDRVCGRHPHAPRPASSRRLRPLAHTSAPRALRARNPAALTAAHPPLAPPPPRAQDAKRKLEPEPKPQRSAAGYNVLTSEGMHPGMDRAHGERRHIVDHRASREAGLSADTPGGRLRDSTSRFFCTADQLPHRPARQHNLETDGLTVTKRTSTVIGVGSNPSQEIFSIGAREVLGDSVYGIQRRRGGA